MIMKKLILLILTIHATLPMITSFSQGFIDKYSTPTHNDVENKSEDIISYINLYEQATNIEENYVSEKDIIMRQLHAVQSNMNDLVQDLEIITNIVENLSSNEIDIKKSEKKEPTDVSQQPEDRNLNRITDHKFRPSDCSEILVAGEKSSGVYVIYPFRCHCSKPVEVYCDMETDGGGWTIFLARENVTNQLNFTRDWEDYKNGFGKPGHNAEYWLGNEYLHLLTTNQEFILRLEAKDGHGRQIWGEWDNFSVESEDKRYQINVGKQDSGSTARAQLFGYLNGCHFSTVERDNDLSDKNCAEERRGGFWYNDCTYLSPIGVFGLKSYDGIFIVGWSNHDKLDRFSNWLQLKIRPKTCSSPISVAKLNELKCG